MGSVGTERGLHTCVQSRARMRVGMGEQGAVPRCGGPSSPPTATQTRLWVSRPPMGTHHPEPPSPRQEVAVWGDPTSLLLDTRHGSTAGRAEEELGFLQLAHSALSSSPNSPQTALTRSWEWSGAEAVPLSRSLATRPPPVPHLHRIQGLGEGKMTEAPNLPHDCGLIKYTDEDSKVNTHASEL